MNSKESTTKIHHKKQKGDGIRLYKVLKFITVFDPKIYKASQLTIVDQCLSTLKPLNEKLCFIPPFYLQNIFPFNKHRVNWTRGERFNFINKNFCLVTSSDELVTLFDNLIIGTDGELLGLDKLYCDSFITKHSSSSKRKQFKESNESKMREILSILNRSLFYYLPKKTGDSLAQDEMFSFQSPQKQDTFDAHRKFFNFEFNKAYDHIVSLKREMIDPKHGYV